MPYVNLATFADNDALTLDRMNGMITAINVASAFPSVYYEKPFGDANLTTNSTTFVAVDDTAGRFNQTIVTQGNQVLVTVNAVVSNNTLAANTRITLEVNGTVLFSGNPIWLATQFVANHQIPVAFERLLTLPAGSNNVRLRWSGSAGITTLYSANSPMMWTREV